MQVKDFCQEMERQVTAIEERLSAIDQRLDQGGTAAKHRILPIVGDIKNLVTELKIQKKRLETECPQNWEPDKSRLEDMVHEIGSKVDRTWTQLSQGNVGG